MAGSEAIAAASRQDAHGRHDLVGRATPDRRAGGRARPARCLPAVGGRNVRGDSGGDIRTMARVCPVEALSGIVRGGGPPVRAGRNLAKPELRLPGRLPSPHKLAPVVAVRFSASTSLSMRTRSAWMRWTLFIAEAKPGRLSLPLRNPAAAWSASLSSRINSMARPLRRVTSSSAEAAGRLPCIRVIAATGEAPVRAAANAVPAGRRDADPHHADHCAGSRAKRAPIARRGSAPGGLEGLVHPAHRGAHLGP